MKRYLYIIIAVVVIVGAVAGFFWWKNNSGTPSVGPDGTTGTLPTTGVQNGQGAGTGTGASGSGTSGGNLPGTGGNTTGALPGAGTTFGVVSNEPVIDYSVDAQNNVSVVEPDGKIANITAGQASFLSSTQIDKLISAAFSYDGMKVIVNFGDPANPQTSLFDMKAKAWTPLSAGMTSVVWSPNDYRLAYLKNNADGSITLNTLDTSKITNKPVAVFNVNMQDVVLAWPSKNQIAFTQRPSIYAQGSVWVYDLVKKTFSEPALAGYGFTSLWSNTTSSAGLVFSSPNLGRGGSLLLLPMATTTVQPLSFMTLPSKCLFRIETSTLPVASTTPATASTTATTTTKTTKTVKAPVAPPIPHYLALYCAVPQDPSSFNAQNEPDAYYQNALYTADSFYRIHTDNGAIDTVFTPTQTVDGTNLKMFSNVLFFVNRYDHLLYAISIAPDAPPAQ